MPFILKLFCLFRVGLELPSVEVRYQNLFIEAECKVVHGKPIPTLWSTIKDIIAVSVPLHLFFLMCFSFRINLEPSIVIKNK